MYKTSASESKDVTIEQFWPLEETKKVPSISRKKNFKSLIEKYRWRQMQS